MSMNLLAINVGNTRTQFGVFADDKLTEPHAASNDDMTGVVDQLAQAYASMCDMSDARVLLATTCPDVSQPLVEQLRERLNTDICRVEKDVTVPIGRKLDPEAIVGEDRLLNAAGAYDVLKQACVVIDAGTAVTVDYVDGTGTFHGGAIAPGARMMLQALHEHTASLPEVTLARPAEPIGHNTVEAIRSGIFFGIRGLVRELVEQFAQVGGAYPLIIATGGDSELLFKDDELIERHAPHLTLLGIAATMRAAMQNQGD